MVFLEHRPRVYYSLTTAIEATALFVQQHCKGRNCCIPRDPASWPNMAATPDDCERTATVALPTAASPSFISGEVGISAALDTFSTVYELPLTRFKKGQTDRQTYGHEQSLYLALRATPTRGKRLCSVFVQQLLYGTEFTVSTSVL